MIIEAGSGTTAAPTKVIATPEREALPEVPFPRSNPFGPAMVMLRVLPVKVVVESPTPPDDTKVSFHSGCVGRIEKLTVSVWDALSSTRAGVYAAASHSDEANNLTR